MSDASRDALQLVKSLMTLPENSICADCKKKAAKWASSTLGVFICIDCSGIHRSLGTHISFVRSCTLDSWTPEQARLMKRVGNKVGNEYWEARLPRDFMRPNSCDRAGMEAFIRAKYAEGRWAGQGPPPHLRTGGGPAGGRATGPVRASNVYDGYFAHNVQQQQPQHSYIMGGHPVRHVPGSRSVEFGHKQAQEAPADKRAGMDLGQFMKGLAKKDEEVVDFTGSDAAGAPPTADSSSSFDFMKGEAEPEAEASTGSEGSQEQAKPVASTPPPPKPEVEPKKNPVPIAKPVEKEIDFSGASGSTAKEIMEGQGTIGSVGPKKQRLFQKKKGASRFAKKAGSPGQPGNMVDQMLDFSQEARFRPVSAPVVQGGPTAGQVGYYGQPGYGYGGGHPQLHQFVPNPQQQRQYEQYQQQARPQLNQFVPNAQQQRQYEQYQQQARPQLNQFVPNPQQQRQYEQYQQQARPQLNQFVPNPQQQRQYEQYQQQQQYQAEYGGPGYHRTSF